MKKTIIIFIVILAGLFIYLSYVDSKGEYAAEEALWKINKQAMEISKDPDSVPSATYERIEKKYYEFINKFPKSKLTPMAHILIGRLYAVQKNYSKALEKFKFVVKEYSQDPSVAITATIELGKIYEETKDYDDLIGTHKQILRNYPLTAIGLKVPVIIAKIYSNRGDQVSADKAYKDAIAHYKDVIGQKPDTFAAYESMRYAAVCYLDLGKQPEALTLLGGVLIKSANTGYLNRRTATVLLETIDSIAGVNMENRNLAIKIYKDFISAHPKHTLSAVMQTIIIKLGEIKAEPQNLESANNRK
ncbi:MAG: tetratricopeptide repeat protein [Candidatus Omnitrophica bacterium]|nr:tetratricopeptide repeat protein [Candidatus Omnitrophota bacterium]